MFVLRTYNALTKVTSILLLYILPALVASSNTGVPSVYAADPDVGSAGTLVGLAGKGFLPNTPVDNITCGGNTLFVVENKDFPSIKFRTCTVDVDPNTGWACNHGTPFKDCARHVNHNETANVLLEDDVETILPITFTSGGAVDQVSRCYMKKPATGWQRNVTVLDTAWFDALQKTC